MGGNEGRLEEMTGHTEYTVSFRGGASLVPSSQAMGCVCACNGVRCIPMKVVWGPDWQNHGKWRKLGENWVVR